MKLDEAVPVACEADFAEWLGAQVTAFRLGEFDKLDRENLLLELEELLNSHHRELMHRLQVLTVHLLKCEFQPQRKGRSWLATISTQRTRIGRLLRVSPSLRRLVGEYAQTEYRAAVKDAAVQTGLLKSAFPECLPYSAEQLLDDDFVP